LLIDKRGAIAKHCVGRPSCTAVQASIGTLPAEG
jgi:hypothetical protein